MENTPPSAKTSFFRPSLARALVGDHTPRCVKHPTEIRPPSLDEFIDTIHPSLFHEETSVELQPGSTKLAPAVEDPQQGIDIYLAIGITQKIDLGFKRKISENH